MPVVKSSDKAVVLASVKWGYSPGICFLTLDGAAVAALRAAPPTRISSALSPEDIAAAAQCSNHYDSRHGFAARPVPVVKSADHSRVLAEVKWGYHQPTNLCFLVLDDAAVETLRRLHDEVPAERGTALELGAPPSEGEAVPADGRIRVSWPSRTSPDGQPVGYEVQWKSGDQDWSDQRRAVVVRNRYTIWGLQDSVSYSVRVRLAAVETASDRGATISAGSGSRPTAEVIQDAPPLDEALVTSVLPFDGAVDFEMEGEPVWPATVELPVDVSLVSEGEEVLLLHYSENLQAYIPELNAVFDRDRGVITAEVYHLSEFLPVTVISVLQPQKTTDFFHGLFMEYWDAGTRFLKAGWEKSTQLISNIPELAKQVLELGKDALNATGRLLLEAIVDVTLGPGFNYLLTQIIKGFGHGIDAPECSRGILPAWVNEDAHGDRSLVSLSARNSNAIRDCLEPVPDNALPSGPYTRPVGVALNVNRAIPMSLDLKGAEFSREPSVTQVYVYEYDIPGSFGELVTIAFDRLLEVLFRNDTLILPSGTTTKISVPPGALSTGWIPDIGYLEYLDMSIDVELLPWVIDILILAIEALLLTTSGGTSKAVKIADHANRVIGILECARSAIDGVTSFGLNLQSIRDLFFALGSKCLNPELLVDHEINAKLGPLLLAISAAQLLYNGSRALPDLFANFDKRLVGEILEDPEDPEETGNAFTAISAGEYLSCGIRKGGQAVCWGSNKWAPAGEFTAISAGEYHSCGIRKGGQAVCWGSNKWGQLDAPAGEFTAISAGSPHSCGIRKDGQPVCWSRFVAVHRNAPAGVFTYVSTRDNPWSWFLLAHSDDPAGEFTAISAGEFHSCGIRADGQAVCWGSNRWGQLDAPAGEFTAISAGRHHSCGIRKGGQAVCWGSNMDSFGRYTGNLDAPAGVFTAISAGGYHSCGIRKGGQAVCWGSDPYGWGHLDAPAGVFTAISAGTGHSCGIRAHGQAVCWGENSGGSTTVPTPSG